MFVMKRLIPVSLSGTVIINISEYFFFHQPIIIKAATLMLANII